MKSYNDPAKQQARLKLKDFIEKHLLTHKKPQELRVLCFPGAEQDEEEALEVKEIYDPLNIPRKNITGLEMDKERAQRLRDADLGIHVVESSDLDYLLTHHRRWDVISLDYHNYFDFNHDLVLRVIAGDQLLESPGILCTAYQAQREQAHVKDYHNVISTHRNASTEYYFKRHRETLEDFNTYLTRANDISETPLRDQRSENIQLRLIATLQTGRTLTQLDFFKMIFGPEVIDCIRKDFFGKYASSDVERHIISLRDKDTLLSLINQNQMGFAYQRIKALSQEFGTPTSMLDLLSIIHRRPYTIEDMRSYSYVSNSNTLMYMDMTYARQHRQKLRRFCKLLEYRRKHPARTLQWTGKATRAAREEAIDFVQKQTMNDSATCLNLPERVHLGSAHQIRIEKEKPEIIKYLREGFTPEEVSTLSTHTPLKTIQHYHAEL